MEKIEYTKLPSFDENLHYIVFYGDGELHITLELDSQKSLKEVVQEYLKIDQIDLVQRFK